ncbi:MAG: extracellular solute-binding protein [Planctomycetota bacterium]
MESKKTAGLVARIESEAQRPRCDVFWNNEIMHTLALEEQGMLREIPWAIPANWPLDLRSPNGTWVGIAARARILIVNTELLPDEDQRPTSVMDLINPQWKDNCAIAEPLFGTTSTHFAVIDSEMGKEKAAEFFLAVKENAQVVSGNKQVAQMVSSGQCAFGLTDTDDALIEIDSGLPVAIVFPDQGEDQPGTLRIPNTVSTLKNSPNPNAAVLLANYLASEDIEGKLAMGASGQFPIRPNHPQESRALKGQEVKWRRVDFAKAAQRWPELAKELRILFRGGK